MQLVQSSTFNVPRARGGRGFEKCALWSLILGEECTPARLFLSAFRMSYSRGSKRPRLQLTCILLCMSDLIRYKNCQPQRRLLTALNISVMVILLGISMYCCILFSAYFPADECYAWLANVAMSLAFQFALTDPSITLFMLLCRAALVSILLHNLNLTTRRKQAAEALRRSLAAQTAQRLLHSFNSGDQNDAPVVDEARHEADGKHDIHSNVEV